MTNNKNNILVYMKIYFPPNSLVSLTDFPEVGLIRIDPTTYLSIPSHPLQNN